ncbi:hypothetical protein [Dysgonomonas sp. BGC7]|uniref:hypothetical protein n=1 Tax=Dysgonomonas sp. BGC7 TaxID=1658008 RepID=UPI0006813E38|nr:hypothetical protein [Dysgonomonas sp. BGC7]MBD8387414.1 hypothetical protein [Dysgonomonas sp. BGC7]
MRSNKCYLFLIVFFVTITSACSQNKKVGHNKINIETPYVSIEIDTIVLQTEKECFAAIQFDGKFYAYGLDKGYNLFAFDEDGDFIGSSLLPDKIDRHWMLNYAKKDNQLLVVDYSHMDISMYQIDTKLSKLKKIKNSEAPIYEDEQFIVLKTTHGEWGGMVYFLDKKTKKIYRGYSNEAINVNKFNGNYYVTNYLGHLMGHSSVYEINDPIKMEIFKGTKNDLINNRAESSEKERYKMDGLRCLVDTFDMNIICSFVHKGRMLQMWNEYPSSNKVYLTEIVDNKLEHRYTFNIETQVNYLYNLEKDRHFLNFSILREETEEDKLFGTIEIDNEKIKIHFLKTLYH